MGGSPALIVDRAALSADDVAVDFSIPVQATLSGADPDGGNPFEPPVLDLTLTPENSTAFIREDIKLRAVGKTVDADFRALPRDAPFDSAGFRVTIELDVPDVGEVYALRALRGAAPGRVAAQASRRGEGPPPRHALRRRLRPIAHAGPRVASCGSCTTSSRTR